MQHKRFLFLISLPKEDCVDNNELIMDCISKLRERDVEIREYICRNDLERINEYDIVIIVTHYDQDKEMLLLKDGMLPITDFISSLPENFKGYLDLSFCHSGSVKNTIEKRCPNCITQVSNSIDGTRLKVHLVSYPFVVDKINKFGEVDYHKAYMDVLDELMEYAAKNPDNDTYNDDSLRLGQKRTSIAYPSEAKRKSLVPIHVFLHYAPEKEEVEQDIIKRYPNKDAIIRISSKDFSDVEIGDSLIFVLSFMGYDNQYLHVKDGSIKYVTVSEEIDEIIFTVGIDEEFTSPNFGCSIDVYKDDINKVPIKKYPLIISIKDIRSDLSKHIAIKPKKFAQCVIKPESADAVIKLLHHLIEGLSEPKDIMMRICAAKDAGVIRKPTWSQFCEEFGRDKIKSKTSFNNYTTENGSYCYTLLSKEAYNRLIEQFKELI